MNTHEQPTTDKLAVFRQQVREKAQDKKRGKMSEEASLKLRALKEAQRIEGCEGERFASALRSVVVNHENLKKLIQRVYAGMPTTFKYPDRRAHKLAWWIAAGYELGREINSAALIMCFSELVPDEERMSDTRFAAAWEMKDAAKKKASRIAREIISADVSTACEKPMKLCKAGKKCQNAGKYSKPAPAQTTSGYCNKNCAASDRSRQKRLCATSNQVKTTESSILAQ